MEMQSTEMLASNVIKILIAVLIGGIVGAEREYQDKAAGFRTIILITVGSALFTIFSISLDPGFTRTRIAANIVTGIGFLGAGAIVREKGRIGGLTTAATIWLSAALGMGVGAGDIYFSLSATVITLIVLLVFPHIEARIDRIREARSYKVVLKTESFKKIGKVEKALEECSLKVFEHHQTKTETTIVGTWKAIGEPKNQDKFVQIMIRDKDIKEFDY